ncbi:hypothetical protein CDO44_03770 [Pigmentiphaga sp. NML080357]|nr:hypothetical protein CDO44_03770 [Pigmentiphaga sp. NML080357]
MQVTSHRSESVGSGQAAAASALDVQDGLQQAQVEEWLSAYMDGELDAADGALAAGSARLSAHLASAEGQADWDLYHLIGDVVRTPELALPVSAGFHQRFLEALEQEASIVAAPRRPASRRFMTRYGFPGLAAAAAVASVTWIAQPYFGGQGVPVEFSASAQPAAAPAIVPVSAPARARRADQQVDVSLGEYLDAHRQIAGRSAIRQVSATSVESPAGQR